MTDQRGETFQVIAAEAFDLLGTGRQTTPFSARYPGFALEDAYRITAEVRAARERRGERPIGRKIGFSNRTIWAEYDVHAPIWGYVYDRTARDLPKGGETFPLSGLSEPRIEPEIMFGLQEAPQPGMSERELLACIEWVAHGFELVQSLFPEWKFAPADTVAGYGLHGALLIGPRHPVGPRIEEWERELSNFEIALFRNGERIDEGHSRNVLDGPLSALRHLVDLLAVPDIGPQLGAGEIVTTGTVTRAFPVAAGEVWTTELRGIPLEGARLRFG